MSSQTKFHPLALCVRYQKQCQSYRNLNYNKGDILQLKKLYKI